MKPENIDQLAITPARNYRMRAVPFDLLRETESEWGTLDEVYVQPTEAEVRVLMDVLSLMKEDVASRPGRAPVIEMWYQKDNEDFDGWKPADVAEIAALKAGIEKRMKMRTEAARKGAKAKIDEPEELGKKSYNVKVVYTM